MDGLRRSPGFASEDAEAISISNWLEHPDLADGLPGNPPSDRLRFSRLQLRGSAGIAPASLSSPHGKDAQTEKDISKNGKHWCEEFTGREWGKSTGARVY